MLDIKFFVLWGLFTERGRDFEWVDQSKLGENLDQVRWVGV